MHKSETRTALRTPHGIIFGKIAADSTLLGTYPRIDDIAFDVRGKIGECAISFEERFGVKREVWEKAIQNWERDHMWGCQEARQKATDAAHKHPMTVDELLVFLGRLKKVLNDKKNLCCITRDQNRWLIAFTIALLDGTFVDCVTDTFWKCGRPLRANVKALTVTLPSMVRYVYRANVDIAKAFEKEVGEAADAEEADVVVNALRYVVKSVEYDVYRFITSKQFDWA